MDKNYTPPTLTIQAYDFITMLQEVEKAVKQGLTFDFVNNSNYPQMLGTIFVVPMVMAYASSEELQELVEVPEGTLKEDQQEKEPETNEGSTEVKEPAKRGRKSTKTE